MPTETGWRTVRTTSPEAMAEAILADVGDPGRVAICGCSGSGKSTLARIFCERLNLPFISIDALFWEPGWREADPEIFRARLKDAVDCARWVTDGSFASASADRFRRADLVVLFDLPPWLCLMRAGRRVLTGLGKVRPEMAPGCPERLDWGGFLYIWRFRRDRLPALEAAIADHAACPVIRIVR